MAVTLVPGEQRQLNVQLIPIISGEPSIILTYPVGGETWHRSETYNITWQAVDIGYFEIWIRKYVPDWGNISYEVGRAVDSNLGIYVYTVPLDFESAQYRIRLDAWSIDGEYMRANGNVIESDFLTIQ